MFLNRSVAQAKQAAKGMAIVERLTDADIAEVKTSTRTFADVEDTTGPLARFLDFMHALRRLDRRDKESVAAIQAFLDGQFGDPVRLAAGIDEPLLGAPEEQPSLLPDDAPKTESFLPEPATVGGHISRKFMDLLRDARALARREHFLHWQIAFPGVWQDWESSAPGGGFDAVIGNPPYVRQELLRAAKPYLKQAYASYHGMADLYVYFYELGLKILRPGGRLSYIVTNKWMKAGYGEPLRRFFADKAWVESVVDFGHAKQIFENIDVFPSVIVARRPAAETPPDATRVCVIPREQLRLDDLPRQVSEAGFEVPRASLDGDIWQLEPPAVLALIEKIKKGGIPLEEYAGVEPFYGIKTAYNEAFLIDNATRDAIVAKDPGVSEVIKPYLRGQDIGRWAPHWAGLWMIVLKSSTDHSWSWAEAGGGAEEVFRSTYANFMPRPWHWNGI
jgi:hypothetical protein